LTTAADLPSIRAVAGGAEKKILVVEDERDLRVALALRLRERGLVVDEAEGGRVAMERLGAEQYDVIVLDLVMPPPDGFAILDALSAGSLKKPAVVLVMTGADPAVFQRLDPDRIHGVVRKPFDPDELAALVNACADIRPRPGIEIMAMAVISTAALFELL
jgi:DNA-binding response OmpR family regulator